ncbi:MAG: hypothetical protein JSC189_000920 [Candidatus Tokpelaia sp. JSC189]|nr:MAG: hypothetical protein JSC189_000920 [Candidatus Tokpelaia sp. JSC189]
MKLTDYMTINNISTKDMATLIGGMSASGVKKWLYGERTPRPDQMRRIAEVTKGMVLPNDFVLLSNTPSMSYCDGRGLSF